MTDTSAQEPTMEEILASIRRIISEDDAPAETAGQPQAAAEPAPAPEPAAEAFPVARLHVRLGPEADLRFGRYGCA